jgi:uncharacterized protein YjbJ (UPF0337 family)
VGHWLQCATEKRDAAMGDEMDGRSEGILDQATGKGKEVSGKLTDDEDMEAEGKLDQAGGRVKEGVADVKDAANDVFDDLKD